MQQAAKRWQKAGYRRREESAAQTQRGLEEFTRQPLRHCFAAAKPPFRAAKSRVSPQPQPSACSLINRIASVYSGTHLYDLGSLPVIRVSLLSLYCSVFLWMKCASAARLIEPSIR